MTLSGIGELTEADEQIFIEAAEGFVEEFYADSVDVVIELTEITVTSVGRRRNVRRKLQDSVVVTYNQRFQFRSSDEAITAFVLASDPFEGVNDRDDFTELLVQGGFTGLVSVSTVDVRITEAPTIAPEDSGLSKGAIIGIGAGGGLGFLALVVCLLFVCCQGDGDYASTDEPPENVKFGISGDEVSTLAPPHVQGGAHAAANSLGGYEDPSVATVDYDYTKAYGGGGDTSVSSAGGTFGSNPHSALDASKAAATGADNFDYRRSGANVREELINIFAPPGKLGVVIDTPDEGAPVVHAVKDSSVIANQIQVGDKLVAVDDEDVRPMTAIKVSKLISRKSANPSRKLTIVRTTVIE